MQLYIIYLVKRLCRKRKIDGDQPNEKLQWKLHICSENNFPTAAGLASSAAGYACLGKLIKIAYTHVSRLWDVGVWLKLNQIAKAKVMGLT